MSHVVLAVLVVEQLEKEKRQRERKKEKEKENKKLCCKRFFFLFLASGSEATNLLERTGPSHGLVAWKFVQALFFKNCF